jgi:hypothetical protein
MQEILKESANISIQVPISEIPIYFQIQLKKALTELSMEHNLDFEQVKNHSSII